MNRLILLLLCFSTISDAVKAQRKAYYNEVAKYSPPISFKDFKVPLYDGKIAKTNLYSNPTARLFRTALREGYKKTEINFAGHYKLITWGCGSGCHSGAIIDVKTGRVFDIPGTTTGYDFKANSRMLVINPPFSSPPDTMLYYHKCIPYEIPEIYIFNERIRIFKKYDYEFDGSQNRGTKALRKV